MMAATSTRPLVFAESRRPTTDREETGRLLLDVLGDEDCRAILEATGDEARSANELADACDVPLSTVYRKLERLTDAGLLEEGIRLRRSGKHTREYVRCVDDVHVSVGSEGGFELTLGHNDAVVEPAAWNR